MGKEVLEPALVTHQLLHIMSVNNIGQHQKANYCFLIARTEELWDS